MGRLSRGEITITASAMCRCRMRILSRSRPDPGTRWRFGKNADIKPAGDIQQDCRVDLEDLMFIHYSWMEQGCEEPEWCSLGDVNQDGRVGIEDLAVLSGSWMVNCTEEPANPLCNP